MLSVINPVITAHQRLGLFLSFSSSDSDDDIRIGLSSDDIETGEAFRFLVLSNARVIGGPGARDGAAGIGGLEDGGPVCATAG